MSTNVPPPTFTSTGFLSPSGPAILAGVQADFNAAYAVTLNFNLNTPQGQLSSSEAAIIANNYAIFVYYTQQTDPAYSVGRMQDGIARIYFLERNPAEPTALQISCLGASGVVIPFGATINDVSGNLYTCTAPVTIGAGGTVTGSFACTVPGPVAVPSASNVSIYQAIPGWDAVTVLSGVQGVNVESAQEFEIRRQDSVEGNALGTIGAIIGAVAKVPGVLDYYGVNNPTAGGVTIGGVTIPANSTYICVAGGSPTDIAQAILSKKGAGSPMAGSTTETAYDSNPLYASPVPYQISFQIPTPLQIVFTVTIVDSSTVPTDATTQIQNALINAFGGGDGGPKARIGSVLYNNRYIPPVAALGSWALISGLNIGSANTPDAVMVGYIIGNTLTVVAVTSGVVVVGQFIFDAAGLVTNGTQVAAFVSGSGGTGTYTVNNTQNVGASFTGSGSGTNLTTSAVTGTILEGQLLAGTGISPGTTILSQTSGTPGGAGVYVTSASTTASGTCTSNDILQMVTADQTLVSVQINQEPQLSAVNITVVLS